MTDGVNGRLSSLITYYVPRDGPLASYKEYISMLPNMDHPEAFGQHPNADITSLITETRMVFDTLLGLQPQISTGGGESREDKVRAGLISYRPGCHIRPPPESALSAMSIVTEYRYMYV